MLSIISTISIVTCLVVWSVIIIAFVALKIKQFFGTKSIKPTVSNNLQSNLQSTCNADFSETEKNDKNNLFLS